MSASARDVLIVYREIHSVLRNSLKLTKSSSNPESSPPKCFRPDCSELLHTYRLNYKLLSEKALWRPPNSDCPVKFRLPLTADRQLDAPRTRFCRSPRANGTSRETEQASPLVISSRDVMGSRNNNGWSLSIDSRDSVSRAR